MNQEEIDFRALYDKYLAWKASQQHQTDGYLYEKSFVEFAQSFTKELFNLSLQKEEVSRKKKSRPV